MNAVRELVKKIPPLRRLRRRYSNYKPLVICCGAALLTGLLLGVHLARAGSGHGGSFLGGVRKAVVRTFAPNIVVGGHQQDGSFVIANFESVNDFKLWTVGAAMIEVSTEHVVQGSYSGKITFYSGAKLSSVNIEEYFESRYGMEDWSGYGALAFNAVNPSDKPLRLILQVKDHYGTPYKEDIQLGANESRRVVVPVNRLSGTIKVKRISQLNFFVWDHTETREIYLDDIRLLPEGAA